MAKHILKQADEKTKISLIFANVSESDILLKKELDDLQKKHGNFKVYYVLNNVNVFHSHERSLLQSGKAE